ncbi:hypothetical protein [Staphylococcus equorum]|uniref:hypothetical protein n=1 Tax=Staphylococcus equorum TaxID=246432 RepID=UPI000397DDEE|nr:hypothetical protein [Staphylococcus equorum]ERH33968.1 hypothetical protein SEQU_13235 [Staphylococcus equorum UMC-CNS-924]OEK61157.1 hypothetical protein ASS99_10310 [Staphylococcus equorum]
MTTNKKRNSDIIFLVLLFIGAFLSITEISVATGNFLMGFAILLGGIHYIYIKSYAKGLLTIIFAIVLIILGFI